MRSQVEGGWLSHSSRQAMAQRTEEREDAKFDEWRKEITPSKELRQWFHEDKEQALGSIPRSLRDGNQAEPDFIPFLREIESIRLSLSSRQRRMYNIVIYLY